MAKCIALSNYSTAITNILIIGAGKIIFQMAPFLPLVRVIKCLQHFLYLPGPAGLVCAETLRQEGFSDRIVMCTSEKYLPYDRSKLSKVCMFNASMICVNLNNH